MYFLVDSEVCLILQSRVRSYTPGYVRDICCLDGSPLPIVGTVELRLCKGSKGVSQLFYVAGEGLKIASDGILGQPFLEEKRCVLDSARRKPTVGSQFSTALVSVKDGEDRRRGDSPFLRACGAFRTNG